MLIEWKDHGCNKGRYLVSTSALWMGKAYLWQRILILPQQATPAVTCFTHRENWSARMLFKMWLTTCEKCELFYWFLQRLKRIVRRSENMTMYSTCIWIFKLLKPVTFKKGIIKYIMMSLCFFRSVYLFYTCLQILSLSQCLSPPNFLRPAWLL